MFSNLGPLFKTVFRQAEETDTRQEIRREEKEQNRKHKNDEENHHISIDLWEDKSSVSVDALRAFLISFIKGETFQKSSAKSKEKNSSTKIILPDKKLQEQNSQNSAKTTAAARAASAYQSINEKTSPSKISSTPNKNETIIADADLIESKEARQIYTLIEDLDFLKEHGITEISIEPASSFVESLQNAVSLQKSHFNK